MNEEKRLMIENDLCMNKSKAQVIKLYLDLLDDDIKQKEVLDKIKKYANNRLQYYNEMRRDYLKEFDGYAENDNENILELLEELK